LIGEVAPSSPFSIGGWELRTFEFLMTSMDRQDSEYTGVPLSQSSNYWAGHIQNVSTNLTNLEFLFLSIHWDWDEWMKREKTIVPIEWEGKNISFNDLIRHNLFDTHDVAWTKAKVRVGL
jgi:hypothetical protein